MATGLKRFVRSLLGERVYGAAHAILMAGPKDIGYHRLHAVEAAGILKSLEDKYGRTNPTHIRLADAYARDVLGHACYAPWLRVYTAFARTFKEGWIPDNYYGHIVVPAMKGWYGQISNLKALTSTVFRSDAFPDVACYVNGLFLGTDNARICERDVAAFLFRETDRVTFKADHSIQGNGVHFFDRSSFDIGKIRSLGNGVFQNYIIQHPVLEAFAPRSVATLRITSAVDDAGHVGIRACYIRFGRKDDTHVQSKTHVRVPVDPATGKLAAEGYLTTWLPVAKHPDTGIPFVDGHIPAFDECLATVRALHEKVRFARCVGWDVAVDRDERVRLMEWNAEHNDIKFSECTQGPCFADLRWDRLCRKA
jgi:hypothetical protein